MRLLANYKKPLAHAALALLVAAAALDANAQTPLRIGFITTLSTPAGYIGEDERDGFLLAVREEGDKLGGVPVRMLIEDDALKPANAKQIADKMVQALQPSNSIPPPVPDTSAESAAANPIISPICLIWFGGASMP